MSASWKSLSTLCLGGLLLACTDLGHRDAPPSASNADAPSAPAVASEGAQAAYRRGRNAHLARRFDEAEQAYRAALTADPRHVAARNGLATLYAEQGHFDAAIALWRELTAQAPAAPESAYLYSNLGYAYFLSGDADQALAALEKACLLDPLNHHAWQHLGSALEKLGQSERAQLMYRQARALEEHDFKADYALAEHAGVAAIEGAVSKPALPRADWPSPTASGDAAPAAGDAVADVDVPTSEERLHAGGAPAANIAAPEAAGDTTLAASGNAARADASHADVAAGARVLPAPAPLRLEIRNGNGVAGMARAVGRGIAEPGLLVVRLSNEKGFAVHKTRVEYPPEFQAAAASLAARFGAARLVAVGECKTADVRVVLGHDLSQRGVPLALAAHQTASKGGS